jgi:hypothetical protein
MPSEFDKLIRELERVAAANSFDKALWPLMQDTANAVAAAKRIFDMARCALTRIRRQVAQVDAETAGDALVEKAMLLDATLVATLTALDETYRLTGHRGLLIWDPSPAMCKALWLLASQLDQR